MGENYPSGHTLPSVDFFPISAAILDDRQRSDEKAIGQSNWLPVFEYPLVQMLQLFPFEHFLRLLTCTFLEHRIVLLSTGKLICR